MEEIKELKTIFLADDVDSDDYKDNLNQITEWEKELVENEAMQSWKDHDITKKMMLQAEATYVEISVSLATNRTMTNEQRISNWGKIDACLWFISMASTDFKSNLESIKRKVRTAINATK